MTQICEEDIKNVVNTITIPPQPRLLMEWEKACPDINKVIQVVSSDPSLVASVMKTVNAPFFGMPKKVTNINQAVMLLGLDNVKNIVNAVLLKGSFDSDLISSLEEFWHSTNEVAIASALIARKTKSCSENLAYLLGLFHNAGVPVMCEKYSDYQNLLERTFCEMNSNTTQIENEQYKANHAVVGYYISTSWHLPKSVSVAIRDHHNKEVLANLADHPDPETAYLLATLKVAEHVSEEYKALGKENQDYEWSAIESSVLDFIGLVEDDLLNLSEELLAV